jgi:single-stranded-DNA-specific exonuclease
MPKQWIIASPWPACSEAARRMGVSPLLAQLMYNRGIVEASAAPDAAAQYLSPQLKNLHAPELLPGVTPAARLIAEKARTRCRIVIYGDYDVDGITGTTILWRLLTLAGADVGYYIPHRLEEGYGLNAEALRQLKREGADTVITVDCGITAIEEAKVAREIGLTLVITDHHALSPTLPDVDNIVHPQVGEGYPNHDLCGAGVAFKLAWAVARELCDSQRVTPEFRQFLLDATGLAALGTIADVVPLVGENRILARFGLTGLRESKLPGLIALIESARLADQKLDADHVGFWLAPRLNAAGRMGHAQLAVELLTHATPERGREIAIYLEEQNRQRQSLERRIFKEACEQIDAHNLASDARRAIVVAAEDWHAGVIGIVASRIVERYHRPAIMIALSNGQGQGSGRSIRQFALHEALADCAEHLLAHGGHSMAAGLRIEREKVPAFAEAFVGRANVRLTGKDLEPVLRLDAEIPIAALTEPLVRDLQRLEPFGSGNPRPRFASQLLRLDGEPRLVGKTGDHLLFALSDGTNHRKAIAFGQKDKLEPLQKKRQCRVAFEPVLNTYNGRTSVELQVLDMEFPE